MHILVTGAAGFIGSHLTDYILQNGHSVVGIDNCITGSLNNVAHLKNESSFRLIQENLITFDPTSLSNKVDIVFHMASPASPIQYKKYPVETLEVNSIGTKVALQIAKLHNASFVYASTSEVYGDPLQHPQTESYWGNVNPNGVRSCYDEAKRFGEAMTMTYVRTFHVDARIARIFNTYGPRMDVQDGRVVSNFIVQALKQEPITIYGNGVQTRSFCYVDDLVRGLWLLATKKIPAGSVINLGNPNEKTIRDIALLIKELTSSPSSIVDHPIEADDPQKRKPDITKAFSDLGWQPEIHLVNGLQKTIEYFKTLI
jgi:nucleoside-diphosphate-sugar epimerase